MEDGVLGSRIARIRIRRSMTQEELAERAGVSTQLVYKIEQGKYNGSIPTLYALAGGLGVPTASLFDSEAEGETVEQDHALLLPLRRLLLVPGARADDPIDETGVALAELRERVLDCTADYNRARYTKLAVELPRLVRSVDAAVGLYENEDKAAAYRLLAHAYRMVAQLLIQLRSEDLACDAVRRAMGAAEKAGDPVLRASAARDYAWAFTRQRMFADAQRVATDMAAEIGEPSITSSASEHLAAWGLLLAEASRAAAFDGRPDAAEELLSHAHSAAVRMDAGRLDYGKYWTTFSPTRVAITRVENALIGGDAELALHLGGGIQRPGNLHLDVWTGHLLDMAYAQASTRNYATAIETMKAIRTVAPEWLKNHRVAHRVVLELLDATTVRRHKRSGLAELAAFMQVEP